MFCHAATMICGVVICCIAMASIRGIVVYYTVMVLRRVIVRHAPMVICTIIFGCTAMGIGGIVFGLTATRIRGNVLYRATLATVIAVFPHLVIFCPATSANFGDRQHCLLLCHFGNTQQSAKEGTHGKDASNRGEATGSNQPA
jgi:hypothetical protein